MQEVPGDTGKEQGIGKEMSEKKLTSPQRFVRAFVGFWGSVIALGAMWIGYYAHETWANDTWAETPLVVTCSVIVVAGAIAGVLGTLEAVIGKNAGDW